MKDQGTRVVVIGGGGAGLSCALSLLDAYRARGGVIGKGGLQLTVLEAREQLGGRIGSERHGGFSIETGPAILQVSSYWKRGEAVEIDFLPDRAASWLVEAKRTAPRARLSKLLGEHTADSFARRHPAMTISSLRLPAVMTPDAYHRFDPAARYLPRSLWAYADVREVARAIRLVASRQAHSRPSVWRRRGARARRPDRKSKSPPEVLMTPTRVRRWRLRRTKACSSVPDHIFAAVLRMVEVFDIRAVI